MIKVKEYLDANLFVTEECPAEKKTNGHYKVFGHWFYPKEIDRNKDYMSITINNETIIVDRIIIDGKTGPYGYLQTYEHIPRGDPDENGYYSRSTDEEIIKYLDERLQKIKNNENK